MRIAIVSNLFCLNLDVNVAGKIKRPEVKGKDNLDHPIFNETCGYNVIAGQCKKGP